MRKTCDTVQSEGPGFNSQISSTLKIFQKHNNIINKIISEDDFIINNIFDFLNIFNLMLLLIVTDPISKGFIRFNHSINSPVHTLVRHKRADVPSYLVITCNTQKEA